MTSRAVSASRTGWLSDRSRSSCHLAPAIGPRFSRRERAQGVQASLRQHQAPHVGDDRKAGRSKPACPQYGHGQGQSPVLCGKHLQARVPVIDAIHEEPARMAVHVDGRMPGEKPPGLGQAFGGHIESQFPGESRSTMLPGPVLAKPRPGRPAASKPPPANAASRSRRLHPFCAAIFDPQNAPRSAIGIILDRPVSRCRRIVSRRFRLALCSRDIYPILPQSPIPSVLNREITYVIANTPSEESAGPACAGARCCAGSDHRARPDHHRFGSVGPGPPGYAARGNHRHDAQARGTVAGRCRCPFPPLLRRDSNRPACRTSRTSPG